MATKLVTATFTVKTRPVWSLAGTLDITSGKGKEAVTTTFTQVKDDEGQLVALFPTEADAKSAVSDHNRTGRIRAKARERRKEKDAQSA